MLINVMLIKKHMKNTKRDMYIDKNFNSCIIDGVFPDKLKLVNISPIFRSVDSMAKKNYKPVSILYSVFKPFEILIQKQLFLIKG